MRLKFIIATVAAGVRIKIFLLWLFFIYPYRLDSRFPARTLTCVKVIITGFFRKPRSKKEYAQPADLLMGFLELFTSEV